MSAVWTVGETFVYDVTCSVNSTGGYVDPDPLVISFLLGDGSEEAITYGAAPESGKAFERLSAGQYRVSFVLPAAAAAGTGSCSCRVRGSWESGGFTWTGKQIQPFEFTVLPDPRTYSDVAAP